MRAPSKSAGRSCAAALDLSTGPCTSWRGRSRRLRDVRRFKSLLALVGLIVPLFAMLGVPAAEAAGLGYNVFVGYADNLRSATNQSPTPWEGSAGIIFEGCTPLTSCT